MLRFLAFAIVMASSIACTEKKPPAVDPGGTPPNEEQKEISIRAAPSRAEIGTPIDIFVGVSDSTGRMLPGRTVSLESSVVDDVLAPTSGETRPSGAFSSTLTGTTPGVRRVTARVGDVSASVEVELLGPVGPACPADLLVGGQPPALAWWPEPFSATALLTGDLDGDGRDDLVVTLVSTGGPPPEGGNGRIFVRLRAGEDGTPVESTVPWPAGIRGAALADFDGDGVLDLALATRQWDGGIASEVGTTAVSGTHIDLLAGNGDGSFRPASRILHSDWRDAKLTGVVPTGETRARLVAVFGTWMEPSFGVQTFRIGDDWDWQTVAGGEFSAFAVVAGDFDLDGRVDLATTSDRLELWMESDDGAFLMRTAPDSRSAALHIGDLNGDGTPDLLTQTWSADFEYWPGMGDGSFGEGRWWGFTDIGWLNWIGAWDLDGDGIVDLLFHEYQLSSELVWLQGDGSGWFYWFDWAGTMPVSTLDGFVIEDVEGDDRPEMVFLGTNVLAAMPGATYSVFPGARDTKIRGRAFAAGRFSRGGHLSFAIADTGVAVFRMNDRTLSPTYFQPGNQSVLSMAVRPDSDPTHDADDLVLLRSDGALSILSAQKFSEVAVPYSADEPPRAVVSADFDGDGRADLALSTWGTIFTLLSNEDGSYRQGPTSRGAGGLAISAGDFDGDGHMDLAVTGSETVLLRGDGVGGFLPLHRFQVRGFDVTVADLNRDGMADVIVGGTDGVVSVIVAGARMGALLTRYEVGGSYVHFAAGDFDGDGVPDLAASGPGETLSILRGAGDGTFASPVHYPAGSDDLRGLAFGPFSGSARSELLLFRADGGVQLMPVVCGAAR